MHVKISRTRRIISVCVIVALFCVFAADLVKIQLIDGEQYAAKSSAVSESTVKIKAARGRILDTNGMPFVYNEEGYAVIFDAAYFPTENAERNALILSLINLFESSGVEWIDNLPINLYSSGNFGFKEDSEKEVAEMKSKDMLNLNEYASAHDCFNALVKEYELEEYTVQDAFKVASVRYEMTRTYFRMSSPYTFAQEVPEELVAKIKENSNFYKGVDVEIVPVRKYADGTIAPHILGRTGAIDADEYAAKKELGYGITDDIGKSGIELAAEKYLRGTDGEKTIYTNDDGERNTVVTTEPVQGNTVVLTINRPLQEIAYKALEDALLDYAGTKGNMVENAGAVVVLDVKDAAVLSSVSYPGYDISTYSENAEELNKASGSPLWNRALLSTYATGSTMKPSVAIAALEEKQIDEEYTVYCSGKYTYLGQTFKCEQSHVTNYVNVVNAIDESCNTFFYEVGKNLGIEKMNEYRILFGFGAKTGCEIGEAAGVLDSPEYRASLNQTWLPGYTVQSAIGQAGNLFTPIQLANYTATIANGGTRYRTHFIKSVKSYDCTTTLIETKPEIMAETGVSKETLDIVRRGMLEVGTTGYCSTYFAHLPIKVAAKTGTSQEIRNLDGIAVKINNGFLIAFAPYEKPEIAIACVGEGMTSGAFLSTVVARICEYYFGVSVDGAPIQAENTLIP